MALNIKIYGFNVKIVNAYSPTEVCSETMKDSFYKLLQKSCQKTEKHEKLVIAGDLNAKTSLALKKCCYDGSNIIFDEECNDNGERLKTFCMRNKLCISSSFFDYPDENRYTWYSCDKKTKRKNDYVLVEPFVQQYVTDCKAEPDIDFDSDHRILITKLNSPMTRKARWKERKHNIKYLPLNIKSLENEEIKNEFIKNIESGVSKYCTTKSPTLETSTMLTSILNSAAELSLPRLSKNRNTINLWKSDKEFNELLSKRMNTARKSDEYKTLTKEIKKRVKHLKNLKLQAEATAINTNADRRQIEELYKNVKKGNTAFKQLQDKQQCDPIKLKKYFQAHFNQEVSPSTSQMEPTNIKHLQSMNIQIENKPPDKDELISNIKALKNGKSSNDFPAAYIKYGIESDGLISEIVNLYTNVWETKDVPKTWGHTKLVALWKGPSKGKKEDPSSYRGLQIGSTFCKLFINVIINRLKTWYENQMTDQQQGFRSGRGTTDSIYIIKRVHEVTDKKKMPVNILFVDLAAAFDHVERSSMFKTIRRRLSDDSDSKLLDLLETLYEHTTTALAQNPEDEFELTNGVRQGGPESPVLFNLYIDFVMRIFLDLCKLMGIKFLYLKYKIPKTASQSQRTTVGHQTIDWIGYADDLVLTFEDTNNLQRGANLLFSVLKSFHLEINLKKTKTMILNHQYTNVQYPSTILNLNGKTIENVKSFLYLGSNIVYNEPTTGIMELELRIDTAQNKFYEISKHLLNHQIALTTRAKILNTLVRSRLTHSSQTWTITRRQADHLNSVYILMLRKMVRGGFRRKEGTYHYVLTNKEILKQCKTDSLHQYIDLIRRRFVAHVIRGDNDRITKRLLFNDDENRKPGQSITLYKTVTNNEKITPDEFNRKSLLRLY